MKKFKGTPSWRIEYQIKVRKFLGFTHFLLRSSIASLGYAKSPCSGGKNRYRPLSKGYQPLVAGYRPFPKGYRPLFKFIDHFQQHINHHHPKHPNNQAIYLVHPTQNTIETTITLKPLASAAYLCKVCFTSCIVHVTLSITNFT